MADIVIDGVYSNGKSGRFYSERKVINTKPSTWNSRIMLVEYEVVNGYVSHQLTDRKGEMRSDAFATWAMERVDGERSFEVNSLKFECDCGEKLEAAWNMKGHEEADRIHCDCGKLWIMPKPRCIIDPKTT